MKMELRPQNVIEIYNKTVKCVIQSKIGVNEEFNKHKEEIRDMISQVKTDEDNTFVLMKGHIRKDEEQWTPYLQPVIMLVQLACRAGFAYFDGDLKPNTKIHVLTYSEVKQK